MINHPMRLIHTIILALCVLLLPACAERAAPAKSTPSSAPRLAVLSPGFAATLIDLKRDHLIVARHAFDIVLHGSIPVAGNQSGLDYETLVSVRPTHIILEKNSQPLPERLPEFAERYGWQIVRLPALMLIDVRASISALDTIANPDTHPSPESINLTARFDALRDVLRTDAPPQELLLLSWVDPIGVMGPGSYHYELAKHMGLKPLPESGAHYITLSVEDLIRMDPPTIVLLIPDATTDDPASLIPRQARERLTACKLGNVILLNDPAALLASTTLIKLADDLRAALEGNAQLSAE